MCKDTDIHQLDAKRQVLFVLNEFGDGLSVEQIKESLSSHGISPEERKMKSFLNSIRDSRREFIRDGFVRKVKNSYHIMEKGKKYLKSTVVVIDPSKGDSSNKQISDVIASLSGDIKICDPYFDTVACELLKNNLDIRKVNSVRVVLRKNGIKKPCKIGNLELEFVKNTKIHDRFIIDEKNLYVLGASLNNLGDKLSFIFNLFTYRKTFDTIFQSYWSE